MFEHDRYIPRFEIEVQIRDMMGRPTGKTKSYASDNGDKIDEFYQKNVSWEFDLRDREFRQKGRKKKKGGAVNKYNKPKPSTD